MSNDTTIRTMQSDLDELKNKQKESTPKIIQKKTQQPPAQANTLQAVRSDMQQQQPSKTSDIQQDSELKNLLEKISTQTDKDLERNINTDKKSEIVNDFASKNKSETITNKEEALKTITEAPVEKVSDRKEDDIEKLKKLISRISETNPSIEKKSEKNIGDLENTGEKSVADNTTVPSIQRPEKTIQQEQTRKESIKAKQVETAETKTSPAPQEAKNSFWKKISEKTREVSDSEKINALSAKKEVSDIKTSADIKTGKYNNQSGILQSNKDLKQKKEVKEDFLSKKAYYDKNYMLPDERLIHGKQKFYSSISKRIELREDKGELKDLKDEIKMKKQKKIITREEEYKNLKRGIMQKYHIKISLLPWKKVIPVALILLLLTGFVSYFVFSYFKPPAPPAPPDIVVGSELEEFSDIEKSLTMVKNDLKGFNNLEMNALAIFNSDNNIAIIKLIVIDNETDKNILSLQEALDAIGIINIKENINYLPNGFLEATTDNYNLLLFKTKNNSIRYGLAIKIDDENSMINLMKIWEKEGIINKKMTTVLKPLFRNDRNFEEVFIPVLNTTYNGVNIKYISLIDKETALDYFIHSNILVFATSKDSAFAIVDWLVFNEYRYDEYYDDEYNYDKYDYQMD